MNPCTLSGARLRAPSYPMSVLRGCASIDEVEAFKELPDGFIRVVMRLIKKIDVTTPERAIFARRDTLAREAGKSCETVGRALRWLEDQGFISRKQVSRKGFKGSDAHIHPTPKMIEALGFGQQFTNSAPQVPCVPPAAVEVEKEGVEPAVNPDASVSALQNININKQSGETVCQTGFAKTKVRRVNVKVQGKSLPEDLVWMVKQGGLKATAVLCLMKLAKQSGKLLSDVVQVAKEYLDKLRRHDLFAYVRALLNQEKDYAFIVRQQVDGERAEFAKTQEIDLLNRKRDEWIGRRFLNKADGRLFLVEKGGFIAVFENGRNVGSNVLSLKFVHAVQDGDLTMVDGWLRDGGMRDAGCGMRDAGCL